MEGYDFVEWLGDDLSIKVFMHLEDPSDLAHVSAVSTSWRHFVIVNGLFKQLCLNLLPEMSSVAHAIETKNMIDPVLGFGGDSDCLTWECLKRNHRVFAQLSRGLTPVLQNDCISQAISASSTDNYPEETIQNTLEPHDGVEHRASYWSSKGQIDASVPETLLYGLRSDLCLVTEIHIQPFQAYFQYGFPIYSSKAIRFRLGFSKFQLEMDSVDSTSSHNLMGNENIWTYTSPEYFMAQENCLQKFKLPEPVLCIGGILQVELLGRVQKQEMDELYYICVAHVQAVGRPLSCPFGVKILDSTGKFALKYYPETEGSTSPREFPLADASGPSRLHTFTSGLMERGIRGWENIILNTLLGIGQGEEYVSDDEHLDDDPELH